jgi:gliding motility-associated-like protein
VFHQYQDTGSYLVTLDVYENGFGCHDSTSRTVIIGPAFTFYIPNAFTPNFDGFNETFYGRGTNIAKYEMKIFDRWGSMIFKTTDLEKGWDGKTDKDIEIKEGLYIYLIKITDSFNRKHTYRGRVTLVK